MEGTNWIDVTVCSILGLSVLLGLWQGLLSSSAGILAFVAAFFAARESGAILTSPLRALLDNTTVAPFVSVGIIFLATFILCKLLARMVSSGLKKAQLGSLDSMGGGAFGLVRGGVFAIMFILILILASVDRTPAWAESRTVPLLGATLKGLKPLLGGNSTWLRFDNKQRPQILRLAGVLDGNEQQSEDTSQADSENFYDLVKKISPVSLSGYEEKNKQRHADYDEVMKELREYVAVRSAHTPDADKISHSEADSLKETEQRLLCMLRDGKNCETIDPDNLSQKEQRQLEELTQALVCQLEKRRNCKKIGGIK